MKHALMVDVATGNVVGAWSGGVGGGYPASTQDVLVHPATAAEAKLANSKHPSGGVPRWRIVGGKLQEQEDPRPMLRFTPTLVELEVGDAPVAVTVELVRQDGTVRTGVTAARRVQLAGRRVKISIVNGVGALNVPTKTARSFVIRDNADFLVDAPLTIEVDDTEL